MSNSVFISGAAQGIGAAIARLFYQHGYKVGIYDRQYPAAQQLASELGARAHAGILDVRDYAQWQAACQDFYHWAGQFNVLVNNAGVLYSGPFVDEDIHHHQHCIEVNVLGVLYGCHAAFPYLKQSQTARVINLSSAAAIYGQADLAVYSSSKFAVRGLTEALDIEWRCHGIRVFDVMPLFVKTAMIDQMHSNSIHHLGVQLSPEDVAQQVWTLAQRQDQAWQQSHRPVGLKSQWLYRLSGFNASLDRWANIFFNRAHKLNRGKK
ncbi:SDR family oxidoreductase [Acinetobacter larvae]|uniref:Short-chain dehydrogenase n=1 Tax=Acinetobacter larvae TaxID=1789224 RepID=A0A1B2M1V9_9GAMM|nr:SDR family oxidoreductase [Acinetobacter larvae]AOA59175.1 short-chain dehydrogenase [Acinetobacter larvae]